MTTYRLIISFEGKMLGHFEAVGPSALAHIDRLANSLQKTSGYDLELLVAQGERRILETSPDSIRVLSAEPIFAPDKSWPRSPKAP